MYMLCHTPPPASRPTCLPDQNMQHQTSSVPCFLLIIFSSIAVFRLPSCLLACAERPIRAGDQILHTYGDLPDAQLAALYGFIDAPLPPLLTALRSGQLPKHVPASPSSLGPAAGADSSVGGAGTTARGKEGKLSKQQQAEVKGKGGKKAQRAGLGSKGGDAGGSAADDGGDRGTFVNPYTAALVPWSEVVAAAGSVMARMGEVR